MILLADINIWQRLADQGLVLLVLAIAVTILWRKQEKNEKDSKSEREKMQTKIDKYIEEDREKMLDVIEHNTHAFEELREVLLRK